LRIAIVAFFVISVCLIIHSDKLKLVKPQYIPYIGLVPGVFSISIELINHFITSAVPYTLLVYDCINWETIRAYETSGQRVTRLSGFRDFGFYFALLGATYFFKANRKDISKGIIILAISLLLIFAAGYRSYFIRIAVIILIMAWIKGKRVFFSNIGIIAAILVVLSVVNIYVTALPLPVQRTICWFPGKWNVETELEAKEGWAWRKTVWGFYRSTTFHQYLLFGQGQRFFDNEKRSSSPKPLSGIENFVRRQSLHSGLFTALDFTGITGLLFLIFATLRSYYNCFILVQMKNKLNRWMLWIILFYLSVQPSFWITGFFQKQFIQISICMSMLEWIRFKLSMLNDDYQQTETPQLINMVEGKQSH
jgi:hypothetical protein